jgi:site-specific recombinase XerD
VKRLEAYIGAEGLPLEPPAIRAFLAAERDRTSAASAAKHYRNLCVYFHWLLAEGEIKEGPMVRVETPKVSEEAKPFVTETELAALLSTTQGQDFEARRDHAIFRILIGTGQRVSGLADLRFNPTDDKEKQRLPRPATAEDLAQGWRDLVGADRQQVGRRD